MIKFFNTLGHKKEKFAPQQGKKVKMYVCGPTVYDFDHFGHARTFIIFDCLRRFLISEGFKVKFLQNITDVGHLTGDTDAGEDKIIKKAQAEKKDPAQIARFYEAEHFKDMADLNVLKPDLSPRATGHIKDFIRYIQKLIDKGCAYVAAGSVYFEVAKFKDYGQLSGRNINELIAGSRIEPDPNKKNPADFALWKKAEPNHLMQWDSPWGRGFPGWHIECSVMSQKYFGDTLDIHGGAVELVFPHHENEIAQSEAQTGRPFARYWLHSGLVTIKGQKMAKSAGNFVTIKDLLKNYDADTIRLAVLKTHWRRPLDYDEAVFKEAAAMIRKLVRARSKAPEIKTGFKAMIAESLRDDFNTPRALTIIWENLENLSVDDFAYIEAVFGLKLEDVGLTDKQKDLIAERERLRQAGDFTGADAIRKKLAKEGIAVEDTPSGARVTKPVDKTDNS